MEDIKVIVKAFVSKNLTSGNSPKDCGYFHHNAVYVLYSDGTWETFLVYEGSYYDCPQNAKFNPGTRLKGKSRNRAIKIIEEMLNNGSLVATLLV